MAINNARQFRGLRDVHAAALRALIGALGAKEPYTQGHAARVAQYLVLLGLKLGWPDDMVKRAEEAAYLHDIGKLAVSDTILLKPGPLSEREWTVMRAHPETSEEILRPMIQAEAGRTPSVTTTKSTMAAVTQTVSKERTSPCSPARCAWPTPTMPCRSNVRTVGHSGRRNAAQSSDGAAGPTSIPRWSMPSWQCWTTWIRRGRRVLPWPKKYPPSSMGTNTRN